MITPEDKKRIDQIVKKFSGDQKPTLINMLNSLLRSHNLGIKRKMITYLEWLDDN